jgi:hypothetical protein
MTGYRSESIGGKLNAAARYTFAPVGINEPAVVGKSSQLLTPLS